MQVRVLSWAPIIIVPVVQRIEHIPPKNRIQVRFLSGTPNMTLRNFEIDEAYIIDVSVRIEHDFIKDRNNPTNEDIIKILKGWDRCYSISNKDHDEFTKLRNQLEELGYIKTQRGHWNGDRVIKGFKLNGFTFLKGAKFSCAAAMKNRMEIARKNGRTSMGLW